MNASTPRKLTDFEHVNLFSTEIQTAKGSVPWIFASRKAQPEPIHAKTSADATVIVAIITSGVEPRLVVTREFRAPIGAYELAFPAGLIDPGESAEVSASRELREETGLTLTRILHVSPPVASSAGLTDETVAYIYCEASGTPSREHQTAHEDIAISLLTIAELRVLLTETTTAVISSRLYPILVGFVSAGKISLPTF